MAKAESATDGAGRKGGSAPSAGRLLFWTAPWQVVSIAGLGLVGGVTEAMVLLLIVRSALAITDAADSPRVDLPLLGSVSVGEAALIGGGLLLGRLSVQLLGAWISAGAYARLRLRWLSAIVDRSLRSSWEDVTDKPEGMLGELASGVVPFGAAAILNVALVVQQAASLAILLIATFLVNAGAAAAALASVATLAVLTRPLSRLVRRQASRAIEEEQHLATSVAETARTLLELRAFGVEAEVHQRLERSATATSRVWRRLNFGSLSTVAVYQAAALGLILGGIGLLGRSSPGRLAGLGTVILILIRAFAYGQGLQAQMAALQSASPAVLRVDEALRSLPPGGAHRSGQAVPRPLAELRFRGVSYWYRQDQVILDGLDMAVLSGEVVGLQGPSGTGKTTILHLLLGLRSPRAGAVEVNGVDVATISARAWKDAVAFVPQEPMLIEGTVAENIRFFRHGLSDEEVQDAAMRAGLGPDLARWPEGIARVVGQRRHGVSGGQRQRITIARALAGDPIVLLMDEPTSSLDEDAERVVLDTLRALKGQLTVIVAAHRMSTLALCDRVIELERSSLTSTADGPPGTAPPE